MYTLIQWLLFFYLYCFLGWCIETTYVSICRKRFVNRGFMRGPFLPIYGSGAVMMIWAVIPIGNSIPLVFIVGSLAATVLEYITGVCMEALFQVRYWDYSNKKWNLHGHICFGNSFWWGVLSVILTFVIHPPIEAFVLGMNPVISNGVAIILTIYIVADFTLAFKEALDFKELLQKMTKGREEIIGIIKRLEELQEKVQGIPKKVSKSIQASVYVDKLENLNDTIEELKSHPLLDEWKQELLDLKVRIFILKEKKTDIEAQLEKGKKRILRSHPTFTSTKFRAELNELKEVIKEKISRKKK